MHRVLLIGFLLIGGCVYPKPPPVVVIPDSREITPSPNKAGWYEISGGHLKELYEQQRILLKELEKYQVKCPN